MKNRGRLVILSGLFAAFTAIGAFIRIPLPYYVPLTLQTFFVLLAGNVLGPRTGALSQIIYLMIGLSGLPVFAHGGGPGYVIQPTFGYLLGYPVGAYISGVLVEKIFEKKRNKLFLKIYLSNIAAVITIFAIGVFYLFFNLRFIVGEKVGFPAVFWSGFVVFIPGDLIKVFLVTTLVIKLKKYVNVLN